MHARSLIAVVFLASAVCGGETQGQTVAAWMAAGGGQYDDPGNWSPQIVPGSVCCPNSSALFSLFGSHAIDLPTSNPVTPEDVTIVAGENTWMPLTGGDDEVEVDVAGDLFLTDGGRLHAGDGVAITASRTIIGGGAAATTELRFLPGSTGDLGLLLVGGPSPGNLDSLLTIQAGVEVMADDVEINAAGTTSHTASVQANQGTFRQTAGASMTVGSNAASGLAILGLSSGGTVHTGSGGVEVLQTGRILNNGGAVHFGGDVALAGGQLSYREAPGSGASRSFAPGSKISIADGAAANFGDGPLELDSGQTLALEESGGELTADGAITFGESSVVSLGFDTSSLMATAKVRSLDVSNPVTLAGELQVAFLPGGPAPAPGDQFPLLTAAGGFSGGFDTTLLPVVAGVGWKLAVLGDTLTLTAIAPSAGDYNGDGVVDSGDYARWRNTLGSQSQLDADGNSSGMVDAGDLDIWRQQFGAQAAAAANQVQAVPEPLALPVVAFLLAAAGYSRRAHRPTI